MTKTEAAGQRLDVWLHRTRFFKTRALASTFAGQGKVRLTRTGRVQRVDKPHLRVVAGDVLTFALRGAIISVRVVILPHRRGPATEARTCYESAADDGGADQDQPRA